jgi:hypothetical protein
VQVSEAVPVTVADVLFTPLPIVNCRFAGAEAVIVTVPGLRQVARPRLEIDTSVTFDDDQERPSATVSRRLWWLVKVPLALKPTLPCELVAAVAVPGVTVTLTIVGCPAPHPVNTAVVITKVKRATKSLFILGLEPERLFRVAGFVVEEGHHTHSPIGRFPADPCSAHTLETQL